jgi:hypothetical protein
MPVRFMVVLRVVADSALRTRRLQRSSSDRGRCRPGRADASRCTRGAEPGSELRRRPGGTPPPSRRRCPAGCHGSRFRRGRGSTTSTGERPASATSTTAPRNRRERPVQLGSRPPTPASKRGSAGTAARRRSPTEPETSGPGKTQAVRSASIVAVGTIPSTRRASSASRVTNASACSCVRPTYSAS